ncbi:hypothetical protein HDU76_012739 [Blyttiomyces sp. JEL0837]|nr:hypothetical protein HDU76_012739 [Blyttiomyces sp. JEL0837]
MWRSHDPFLRQKKDAFRDTFDSVVMLSEKLQMLLNSVEELDIVVRELLLLSLWGNATDLSMFAGLSEDERKNMKAGTGEENIISNDLDVAVELVRGLKDARVDFVLDNSGFELYSDLLLADYLYQKGHVSTSVFHCKTIPWFVSDTMIPDLTWTLEALSNPSSFIPSSTLSKIPASGLASITALASRWKSYFESGVWSLVSDPFWCSWWATRDLPDAAPALWKSIIAPLSTPPSSLLIFKGDLNYRKLTYDCRFPSTTPFKEAIGEELLKGEGSPAILALRTCKADVCVGLKEGLEAELDAKEGGNGWRFSGKYAVVQFASSR